MPCMTSTSKTILPCTIYCWKFSNVFSLLDAYIFNDFIGPQSTPMSKPILYTLSIKWRWLKANPLIASRKCLPRMNSGDVHQSHNLRRLGSSWQRMYSLHSYFGWNLYFKLDFQANVMFVDSSPHMLPLTLIFFLWMFAARDRWGLWWCCQKVLWKNTKRGEDQFRNDIRDEGCNQSQATILQGLVLKIHINCKSQVWWWILAWS